MWLSISGVVSAMSLLGATKSWAAAAVLSAFAPIAAGAQSTPDQAQVIGVAVQHLTQIFRRDDRMPEGTLRFDPRRLVSQMIAHPADTGRIQAWEPGPARPPAEVQAVLAAIGAEPGMFEDDHVCATESPRSCTLRTSSAIFATTDPEIDGDSARVNVTAWWRSRWQKQPVQFGRFLVVLTRCPDGVWRVASSRTDYIT
ncbi:hypothetical protein FHS01_001394 [Longimicrobium terrae]|uniref:DUF4440 domain-containing protein n=2 Tax=Longimicrobium terrae TaxID=1639882 RepID=A0A841GXA9_9BACT|nr:hypothetical protein [Longimicrobium terrae]MBB4635382.1 hypothetical protein [Longimicrobium terrae]MBB6069776.1 hypothetical protein [Longimicrobium terrae]